MTVNTSISKEQSVYPTPHQLTQPKAGLAEEWRQYVSAFVFGALVLFAVGFLPTDIAHNAAHDTRHAFAFPCH